MLRTIDEVKELRATLYSMQELARDLVADLERIAAALRAAPGTEPEPDWFDDPTTGLVPGVRDREEAEWEPAADRSNRDRRGLEGGSRGIALRVDDLCFPG